MAVNTEIERKFLVSNDKIKDILKDDSLVDRIINMEIFYLSDEPTIRISRCFDTKGRRNRYLLTAKGRRTDDIIRLETTAHMNKAMFEELISSTISDMLIKRRYVLKNGLEIDVYKGKHLGLITADKEFATLEDAINYVPTEEYILEDITNVDKYSNKNLANIQVGKYQVKPDEDETVTELAKKYLELATNLKSKYKNARKLLKQESNRNAVLEKELEKLQSKDFTTSVDISEIEKLKKENKELKEMNEKLKNVICMPKKEVNEMKDFMKGIKKTLNKVTDCHKDSQKIAKDLKEAEKFKKIIKKAKKKDKSKKEK